MAKYRESVGSTPLADLMKLKTKFTFFSITLDILFQGTNFAAKSSSMFTCNVKQLPSTEAIKELMNSSNYN